MPVTSPRFSGLRSGAPSGACLLAWAAALAAGWCGPLRGDDAARPRAEDTLTVALRPQALVRGRDLCVGDVADFEPAQGELADAVRKIVIARAPWPGYTQRVNPDQIQMALRGRLADLSRVQFAGAPHCAVRAAAVKITSDLFLHAAKQHLLRQLPWNPDTVQLSCTDPVQDRYVPIGTGRGPQLEVTNVGEQADRGVVRLKLEVVVDGEPFFHVILGFQVQAWVEVVVASENLARGTLLSAGNTTRERREVRDLSFHFYTDPQEVYGKRAARHLRAGSTLIPEWLETPPVIQPKSLVNVLYETPQLRIALKGTAQEAGAPGDVIRVQSLTTRKHLFAKVLDASTVVVTQ